MDAWLTSKKRGIVGAVTGGGKTIFALASIQRTRPGRKQPVFLGCVWMM
jgi:superfamily II DNA or RNA helicase